MAGLDDYEFKLDGELTSNHLLALVYELRTITAKEADRKLGVGLDNVKYWARELEKAGLIQVDLGDLGDLELSITPSGQKGFEALGSRWIKEQIKPQKVKQPLTARRINAKLRRYFWEFLDHVKNNTLVYLSLVLSVYFFIGFQREPNVGAFSFLLASLMFSMALVIYSRRHKSVKLADLIPSFLRWVSQRLKDKKKALSYLLVGFGLIYSFGMMILHRGSLSLYILIAVFVAATGELLYFPRKNLRIALKFYLGMMLLAGGLVSILNLTSVTEVFLGEQSRLFDLIVGLGMIMMVYLNDKTFHVSVILDRTKVEDFHVTDLHFEKQKKVF